MCWQSLVAWNFRLYADLRNGPIRCDRVRFSNTVTFHRAQGITVRFLYTSNFKKWFLTAPKPRGCAYNSLHLFIYFHRLMRPL